MLVLSRKIGEEIFIGDEVRLVVYHIRGNRVQLGIVAPEEIPIYRAELLTDHREGETRRIAIKAK